MKIQILHENADRYNFSHEKNLTTLEPLEAIMPKDQIVGDLRVDHNKLISLKGCCPVVHGKFWCNNNELKDLVGGPVTADEYNAYENNLESLEGCPVGVTGTFDVSANPTLKSIDKLPKFIGRDLDVSDCGLTSLQGIIKHAKHIGGQLKLAGNPLNLDEPILGLMLIPGLQSVNMDWAALEHWINVFLKEKGTRMENLIDLQNHLKKLGGRFANIADL